MRRGSRHYTSRRQCWPTLPACRNRREKFRAIYQHMADVGMKFAIETPLPTVRFEDLALTSTRSADNTGVRVQVLRRQPDGSWLRIIDRPEVAQP